MINKNKLLLYVNNLCKHYGNENIKYLNKLIREEYRIKEEQRINNIFAKDDERNRK